MKVDGKWIFLENHSMENLDKMYQWSLDRELIEIELGNVNKICKSINEYKENSMDYYIECNHESNLSFCHFGIHRKFNNELIGYVDFQNITENEAELSLSIPDKKYRNKHYGIDAAHTALKYGLKIRNIKNIIFKTRIDNNSVKLICKKLGIPYELEHFSINNYNIDGIKYKIDANDYENIKHKIE